MLEQQHCVQELHTVECVTGFQMEAFHTPANDDYTSQTFNSVSCMPQALTCWCRGICIGKAGGSHCSV